MQIEKNKLLAPMTTFKIGGSACWFVEATSESDVVEAVSWAEQHGMELFVLGGGSNLLVADTGFSGLVLRIALKGISNDGAGLYHVAAGEDWDLFVERAVSDGCAGIECLAGIPGTVGGTPVQNVGAYGQEVATTITQVRAYDRRARKFVELSNEECYFAYRKSRFNSVDRLRFVVTRVDFKLTVNGQPQIQYADLKRVFADGSQPTLTEVTAEVRKIRAAKGMLLVDGDTDCQSAGSFFKNPVVSAAKFEAIQADHSLEHGQSTIPVPHYPASEGQVKLPAAWLIEQAGFSKGYALGRAAISTKHTLALTNLGGATATEIDALRNKIVDGVEKKFAVHLEMEPVRLGF